jgi:putative redox protein
MKARVKWIDGMMFAAESGSGHAIIVDGPPDLGGRNLGMRPMELMLLGLGSCSAVDVIHILRKGREAVTDCVIEIEGERAETDPKVFVDVRLRYIVTGRRLAPAKVERAVALSAEKYCSASAMFGKTAHIGHSIEIIDLDETAAKRQGRTST